MADETHVYGLAIISAFNKEIDFNSDTIKVMLTTSSYVPNQDSHQYKDVSVTNECVGSGYTAGGATMTGPAMSYDAGSNTVKFSGGNVAWPGNTVSARRAVIYDDTPGSNKPLLAYIDFGEDKIPLSITWSPSGVFSATVA